MRLLLVVVLLALANLSVIRGETQRPAVPLFDHSSLSDCELISPEHATISTTCVVGRDGILAVVGKPIGYLQTTRVYENFRLELEWRWSGKPGNSGILVHISSGPIDRNLWPRCIQIQLKHEHAGDLLPMAGARFAEPLSTAPSANVAQRDRMGAQKEKPVGEWNRCEILCDRGEIRVTINGILQNRVTGCVPASGRIGLQLEGAAYEVRNAFIQEL